MRVNCEQFRLQLVTVVRDSVPYPICKHCILVADTRDLLTSGEITDPKILEWAEEQIETINFVLRNHGKNHSEIIRATHASDEGDQSGEKNKVIKVEKKHGRQVPAFPEAKRLRKRMKKKKDSQQK